MIIIYKSYNIPYKNYIFDPYIISLSKYVCFYIFTGIDIFYQSNFSLLVISVLVYLRDAFLLIIQHHFILHTPSKKKFQLPNFHDSLKPAHLGT